MSRSYGSWTLENLSRHLPLAVFKSQSGCWQQIWLSTVISIVKKIYGEVRWVYDFCIDVTACPPLTAFYCSPSSRARHCQLLAVAIGDFQYLTWVHTGKFAPLYCLLIFSLLFHARCAGRRSEGGGGWAQSDELIKLHFWGVYTDFLYVMRVETIYAMEFLK